MKFFFFAITGLTALKPNCCKVRTLLDWNTLSKPISRGIFHHLSWQARAVERWHRVSKEEDYKTDHNSLINVMMMGCHGIF